MSNPWEDYADNTVVAESAPWEDYAKNQPKVKDFGPPEPPIVGSPLKGIGKTIREIGDAFKDYYSGSAETAGQPMHNVGARAFKQGTGLVKDIAALPITGTMNIAQSTFPRAYQEVPAGIVKNLSTPIESEYPAMPRINIGDPNSPTGKRIREFIGGIPQKAMTVYQGLSQPVKDVIGGVVNTAEILPYTKAGLKETELLARGTSALATPVAKGGQKLLENTASNLSGVNAKNLKAYGFGTGTEAKNIIKYGKQQGAIADELLNKLETIEDYIPERKVVDQVLKTLPPINVSNAITAMDAAKEKVVGTLTADAGNLKIDNMINQLKKAADKNGNIPAKDFLTVRRQIDNDVGAAFDKDYKDGVERAGTAARLAMKTDLENAARQSGHPEYVDAMNAWHEKLSTIDDLKGYVGKNPRARAHNKERFINNIFADNRGDARRVLGEFSDIIGSDLLKKAEYASIAKSFGETGIPPFLSPIKTGQKAPAVGSLIAMGTGLSTGNVPMTLAGAGGFALSSPAVASRLLATTGGAANLTDAGLKKAAKKISSINKSTPIVPGKGSFAKILKKGKNP